jgi:hypothetical protein
MLSSTGSSQNRQSNNLQPSSPTPEHITSSPMVTPENQNQLRLAVAQLKLAVAHCLGEEEEHECESLIAQIEGTISNIEQKTSLTGKPKKAAASSKKTASKVSDPSEFTQPSNLPTNLPANLPVASISAS